MDRLRTAFKSPVGFSLFQLVNVKACHLPVELEHKAFWALKALNYDLKAVGEKRKLQLHELEEMRLKLFPRKLKFKWSDPFSIKSVKSYGAIELKDPASRRSWLVNGQRLKHYLGGEVERLTTITHLKEP
ncbi:uncharacterized protein LOC109806937 [Cajanus cajan]|uniref:uncharacterized protein LOC109789140 n=1 Tax=Cajanus cajan TaxID=3821 RepID=UPI00098DB41A|nr:uncharacterized protein LOC109789140 [Cajanus cajan]XP_020225056.1 uncharacterized protein LOC109806937 [Cajanus cajan]